MNEPMSAQLPRPGDVVGGKYVLERLLGQGGMGAVFAARHTKLQHKVAIKVMLAEATNSEAAARFVNEGRAAANIQNEHVVRVSDVDEEKGYAYMVLELLEGEDLAQVLERDRRIAPSLVVTYMLQALEGVGHAHDLGIIHRDLKPSNLFLTKRRDGNVLVKVLDFGISKAKPSSLQESPGALTSTKAMLGSPLYMSPEQLRSSKSVDARADIWAFGIIMFELLTGTVPFMGESLGELFAAILENDAPPVRSRVPEVPEGLDAIVKKCLERRPENRFQSVPELAAALRAFQLGSAFAGASGPMGTRMLAPAPMGAPAHASDPAMPALSAGGSGQHAPLQALSNPNVGAITGDPAKGTVPIGAVTPQLMYQQTNNTWQRTGDSKPRNNNVIVAAALGGFALVGIVLVGIGYAVKHRAAGTDIDPPASAMPSVPVASASEAPTTPVASNVPAPTATTTAAATATVTAPATAAVTAPTTHTRVPGTAVRPPVTAKVEPKVPDPPPPPPKRPPTTKPPVVGEDSR